MIPQARCRPAFALTELAVLILLLASLLAILLVLAPRSRTNASQAESLANLRQIGAITGSYANDNADDMWGFSWRSGDASFPTQYNDLRNAAHGDQFAPAASQAVDIIRRRAHMAPLLMPQVNNWFANLFFSHLVLADYLALDLPLRFMISPGDRNFTLWSNDPDGLRSNAYMPQPDAIGNHDTWRFPYASSYQLPPAFYSPDFTASGLASIVQADGNWSNWAVSPGVQAFGRRRLTDVAFPSHKVMLHQTEQYQVARTAVYFAYPEARIPLSLVDGSAAVRTTASANRGFRPATPDLAVDTTFAYTPQDWNAPRLPGSNILSARYRFTRHGLGGRDFDGQEVPAP